MTTPPAAPEEKPSEPTDSQMLDWLEAHLTDAHGIYLDEAAIVHPFAFDREEIGSDTLRSAIRSAMKKET